MSPEYSIAIARDEVIENIPQGGRHHAEDRGESPEASDLPGNEEGCIRFRKKARRIGAVIAHDVERVELAGIPSIPPENFTAYLTLQGGKMKIALRVPWQDESVQSIAQAANPVIEDEMLAGDLQICGEHG